MDKEELMRGFVEFDKYIVGINSLEILLHSLKLVKEKVTYWQWIYISLHSAVQAYMVLALTCSHSLWTYKKKDMEKWLEKYDANKPLPDCDLDNFLNLYEKTKSDNFLFYTISVRFVPSKTQDWSMKQLNKLRNDFIHYKYGGFTIMSNPPYVIVTDCLAYVEFLAFQSNNIDWFEERYKNETERLLFECRSVIKSLSGEM